MATRTVKQRLSRPFEGDRITLDSELGRRIVQVGKVPPKTSDQLLIGISQSIDEALDKANSLDPGEIRDEIAKLAKLTELASDGNWSTAREAADLLESLHPDTRAVIELSAIYSKVPTREGLTSEDALRREKARRDLRALCVLGGKPKEGRRRPGGRQSRTTLETMYAGPVLMRGRPRDDWALAFCVSVGIEYERATGRTPNRDRWEEGGAFVDLLRELFRSMGAGSINVEWLVRRYTKLSRGPVKPKSKSTGKAH
jgi:hypothetical protein